MIDDYAAAIYSGDLSTTKQPHDSSNSIVPIACSS